MKYEFPFHFLLNLIINYNKKFMMYIIIFSTTYCSAELSGLW